MVFKSENAIKTLADGLAWIASSCRFRGSLHLFDNNVLSHRFFCRLLNGVYSLKLEVMDRIQSNYPAIDLGDTESRVAYQITTERAGDKVQHTLDTFVKHKLQEKFDKLRILVIGERQDRYTALTIPQEVTFDPDKDIIDLKGLLRDAEALPTPSLESLAAVCDEELNCIKKQSVSLAQVRNNDQGRIEAASVVEQRRVDALSELYEKLDQLLLAASNYLNPVGDKGRDRQAYLVAGEAFEKCFFFKSIYVPDDLFQNVNGFYKKLAAIVEAFAQGISRIGTERETPEDQSCWSRADRNLADVLAAFNAIRRDFQRCIGLRPIETDNTTSDLHFENTEVSGGEGSVGPGGNVRIKGATGGNITFVGGSIRGGDGGEGGGKGGDALVEGGDGFVGSTVRIATHIGTSETINVDHCDRHGRPVVPVWLESHPERMGSGWLVERLLKSSELQLYFDPKWYGGTWFVADMAVGDGVVINRDQLADLMPSSPTTTTTPAPMPGVMEDSASLSPSGSPQNGVPPKAENSPQTDPDLRREFMELAVTEARRSMGEDSRAHPKVGAVVVKNGKVLATAHRGEMKNGDHAEYTALERKLADEVVAGATVYTTLEPCTTRNHPKIPCAERLIERKVKRVVIGMLDPNPEICGKGVLKLRGANIVVAFFDHDLMAEIEEMNRDFTRQQGRIRSAELGRTTGDEAVPFLKSHLRTLQQQYETVQNLCPQDFLPTDDNPPTTSENDERCARLADQYGFDGTLFRNLFPLHPDCDGVDYILLLRTLRQQIETIPRIIAAIESR